MKRKLGFIAASVATLIAGRLALQATATEQPPNAVAADSLIREGETHFASLWQLTFGGENAEAYWSSDGMKLIFQSTRDGWPCDQQFVMDLAKGITTRVSTGKGRTTCGYFLDQDRRILYASTHAAADTCPPRPDYSRGYVWPLYPRFDLYTAKPDGSDLKPLAPSPRYDAEATVSRDGKWIVFTSLRDGDLDLYRMKPDGTGIQRLTNEVGYDGGAFFSHDGKSICYRADHPSDSAAIAGYQALLARDQVRPSHMNLWVMNADGTGKKRVTKLPGASFAPYFTPDDKSLIFSSNHEQPEGRNFDLYLVPVGGGAAQPVTRDPTFDGFPMFSPDGQWLVFASNRGAKARGETNLFLARWR